VKSRFSGGAAEKVEKRLTELDLGIARPAESAIVEGKEGPLEEGAEATFRQLGTEFARAI